MAKIKNHASGLFDSLNEAKNVRKTSALCKVPLLKNQEKPQKSALLKKWSFLADFSDFFKNGNGGG